MSITTSKQMIFEHSTSPGMLTRGWAKTRKNGGGPGGDRQTIGDFSRGAGMRIERLSRELREGTYKPGPLRHVSIPKKSGGRRTLAIPTIRDRVAQSAAAMVLSDYLEPHFEDSSYGYRPGRSVQQAVDRVAALRRAGFTWVVDADIRSFFDEVPHAPLIERLEGHGAGPDMLRLVAQWLESFGERGLAQGSPVSPVLANLYLDALDEAFDEDGLRIVRFADDFVILARSEKRAQRGLDRAAKLLAEFGLVLHPEKTRLVPFEEAFSFLGRLFLRSVVVPDPGEDLTLPEPEEVRLAEAPGLDEPILPGEAADPDASDLAPGLSPLYVLSRGFRLHAIGETFAVADANGTDVLRLPAPRVGRIDLGPAANAEIEAVRLAADHGVPVFFLDGYGGVVSVLRKAEDRGRAELHLAQARAALEPDIATGVARAIVGARLRGQQALLKRLNRRRDVASVEAACDRLLVERQKVSVADNVQAAMGHEGAGGSAYWPALFRCVLHVPAPRKRLRHPAPDPVNAILDWTASMLTRDCEAAAERAGLHAGFGVLHATQNRAKGCAYDLMEAFRAPLAEGLTIYLFNNRILEAEDFDISESGCRIGPGSGRRVVETYEHWLARPIRSHRTGRRTTWRNLILEDAFDYARALETGLADEYQPYRMDF